MAAVTVLIVGAGPTGLLLGAELRRRGVDCRIIDGHSGPLPWDRATVVHPRSLEIFESLGIVQPLLSAGVEQRFARLHSAGSVLGEINLSLCGSRYPFNIGVSEEVTESVLEDYLRRHGGSVTRSSRLTGLQLQGDDWLLATIDHGGETELVSARWVVGCDGHDSATRTLSGIEMIGHDITQPWAVFDATATGWADSYEAVYAYLDELPVILTSLPHQRWRVYLRPSAPDSDLVADALSTLRRYLPALIFDEVANPTRFHCHTKVAKQYRSGHVLLAGDAAHLCTPTQGHGMNSGIQDAFNLAWKLALVCNGDCAPALLDSYEAERRPVAEMIAASGDAIEQAQALSDKAERQARDEAFRAAFADATSCHHEAIAEAELDIDYAGSPIVMGDRHEALAPGQRLPDTIGISLADGSASLLHELTHHASHTALIIGASSADLSRLEHCESELREQPSAFLIGTTVMLTARPEAPPPYRRLAPDAAALLGISDMTLLVVRPDGHVGLRADRDHIAALSAYLALLVTGGL